MGRNDNGNKRRGICPVDKLLNLGVNATFASNNIQNLFTFTGDGDVLKIGTLLCQILQLTSENGGNQCIEMITEIAAKALNVKHSLNENNNADMVILGDGILSSSSSCLPCSTFNTTFHNASTTSSSTSSSSSSSMASYSTQPPSLSEKRNNSQSQSQSHSNEKSSSVYSDIDTNTNNNTNNSFHNNMPSAMKIFSAPPVDRIVIKRGRVVSETTLHRTLYK